MSISSKEILAILSSENPEERKQVRSIIASDSAWIELIDAYPELRRAVTLNKSLSAAVLAKLAVDNDEYVRLYVAMKRCLSAELFWLLAADKEESVRLLVALNPKVPRDVLEKLVIDASQLVSEAARAQLDRPKKSGASENSR